uniref:Uncharacterized protein n=1 Tax=Physcomitrium patens TaxID=3218 RepID=A0A2K1KTA5_PHYPA|nr:hypothetical protein PHYPA_003983 [Physcomitrium patens]
MRQTAQKHGARRWPRESIPGLQLRDAPQTPSSSCQLVKSGSVHPRMQPQRCGSSPPCNRYASKGSGLVEPPTTMEPLLVASSRSGASWGNRLRE